MNWLQTHLRTRINAFREQQGLPVLLTPEQEAERYNDELLESARGMFHQIANAPPSGPAVLPMLTGEIEEAAAGMAALNGEDFATMPENQRQPYREVAANKVISARKKTELDLQEQLELEGVFDGLDGH